MRRRAARSPAPTGADCVYQRYLAIPGRQAAFEAAGVNNVDDFTRLYWNEQLSTSGLMIALSRGRRARLVA